MFVALAQAVAIAALTALLFVGASSAVEHILPRGKRVSLKARFPGLLFLMVTSVSVTLLAIPLHQLYPLLGVQLSIPVGKWLAPLGVAGRVVLSIVLGVLILDFLTYCRHRAEHAWFWPIHAVHHSPTELHAGNAYQHPFQIVTRFIFTGIPLSLIYFDGVAVPAIAGTTMAFMEIFIHSPTEIHFGPLRRIFVDARFHRVHHSVEARHFGKNFGVVFTLWDQLFGTAYFPAKDEWPATGVKGLVPPSTVTQFLAFPLRIRQPGQPPRHNLRSATR